MNEKTLLEISNYYIYEDNDTNVLSINYSNLDLETRSKIMELIVTASDGKFDPNDEITKTQIEDKLSKHPLFSINGNDVLQLINM